MKETLTIFILAIIISAVLYKVFIPFFKKINCKQQVLGYVKEHSSKNGTPTMGGVIFLVVGIILSLIFCKGEKRLALFTIAITFSYGVVGFLDDFLKVKNKQNLGLKPYQKIIFQLSISIVVGVFCYKFGLQNAFVPFINKKITLYKFVVPIIIFVFLATTNTVNLTDGLDGLAGNTSLIFLLGAVALTLLQNKNSNFSALQINEYNNLIKVSFAFCGGIIGFLIFNTNKASVFMGDTGSLALGGLISCVSIFTENILFIPIMGICFVLSGLSVIIQVVYFKITKGKRVFLMAPIHHHFQKKGYAEAKIVFVYSCVTLIGCIISILSYI